MTSWTVADALDLDLEGVESLSVEVVGGEVSVAAADGPGRLEVVWLEGEPVEVAFEHGVVTVRQRHRRHLGNTRAVVAATLPSGTAVDVRTVTAPLVLAGLTAGARAHTVSAPLVMRGIAGRVRVETVSGAVEAVGLDGELAVHTVSGDVTVGAAAVSDLEARLVSGDLTVDFAPAAWGTYEVHSTSGDITLRFPEGAGLDVAARSLSGRMADDFGLTARRGHARRTLEGRIGEGGGRLELHTISGGVALLRGGGDR